MKSSVFNLSILLAFISTLFTSCSVIGGIFKAGMGFGILLVVLVVGLILYFVFRGKK